MKNADPLTKKTVHTKTCEDGIQITCCKPPLYHTKTCEDGIQITCCKPSSVPYKNCRFFVEKNDDGLFGDQNARFCRQFLYGVGFSNHHPFHIKNAVFLSKKMMMVCCRPKKKKSKPQFFGFYTYFFLSETPLFLENL